MTVPLALYALAFLPTVRPLLPPPFSTLAGRLLKMYSFPPPQLLPLLPNTVVPPTPTVRTFEQIDMDTACSTTAPDHLYITICILSLLSFSAGFRLVLCRATKNVFFSSGFMVYIGLVAKMFQFAIAQPGTYYTYSVVAINLSRLVIESNVHVPSATADTVHELIMIAESYYVSPFDTLRLVATVSTCSICSAIANMIISPRTLHPFTSLAIRSYTTLSPYVSYPVVGMSPVNARPFINFITPSDPLIISSDILASWATSNTYHSDFTSGLAAIAFSAAIESLMTYAVQHPYSRSLFPTHDMNDLRRDPIGTFYLLNTALFDGQRTVHIHVSVFTRPVTRFEEEANHPTIGEVHNNLTTHLVPFRMPASLLDYPGPQEPHMDPLGLHVPGEHELPLCTHIEEAPEPVCPLPDYVTGVECLEMDEDGSALDVDAETTSGSGKSDQMDDCDPSSVIVSHLDDVFPLEYTSNVDQPELCPAGDNNLHLYRCAMSEPSSPLVGCVPVIEDLGQTIRSERESDATPLDIAVDAICTFVDLDHTDSHQDDIDVNDDTALEYITYGDLCPRNECGPNDAETSMVLATPLGETLYEGPVFPTLNESPEHITLLISKVVSKIKEMEAMNDAMDESIKRVEEQAKAMPPHPLSSNPPAYKNRSKLGRDPRTLQQQQPQQPPRFCRCSICGYTGACMCKGLIPAPYTYGLIHAAPPLPPSPPPP